ncbi:MAG: hypothetical protein MI802_02230, partial [Desulfobacterales bacterium]|nr:hypothetical protein [Desulfobacterales bacterium]
VLPTKPGQSGVVRGLIGEGLEYCGIGGEDFFSAEIPRRIQKYDFYAGAADINADIQRHSPLFAVASD